ncbi:MAG: hypothetical protein QM526_00405 [Alphaproteobacteria bacterium]|nr:hypothetical protein [Alphaproteobacteria bacterium]
MKAIPVLMMIIVAGIIFLLVQEQIFYARSDISQSNGTGDILVDLLDGGSLQGNTFNTSSIVTQKDAVVEPPLNVFTGNNTLALKKGIASGHISHTVPENINATLLTAYVDYVSAQYTPSPFAGLVAFYDIPLRKTTVAQEQNVLLWGTHHITSSVNITGWKLVNHRTRNYYTLPSAIEQFNVPASAGGSVQAPLQLKTQDIVFVNSGRSPTGYSFKVNTCTGFRTQFFIFNPPIKQRCPSPQQLLAESGYEAGRDPLCLNAVIGFPRCTALTTATQATIPQSCIDIVQRQVTEESCIRQRRFDANFLVKEWRVYLESGSAIWPTATNNAIYLLDAQDRLVATYIY